MSVLRRTLPVLDGGETRRDGPENMNSFDWHRSIII